MPKLRIRVPVVVDVEPEDLEVLAAVGKVVQRARSSGLVDALRELVSIGDRALTTKRRRRKRVGP